MQHATLQQSGEGRPVSHDLSDSIAQTSNLTEAILDSVAEGVFTVDQDLRIAYWNKGAENITGFTADQALGKHCCEVFRANLCGEECPMKTAIKTGFPVGPTDVEIVTRDLEGVHVTVSASALRDRDGAFMGGVEAFRELRAKGSTNIDHDGVEICQSVEGLVSRSPTMKRILGILPAVGRSDTPVLIIGNSGSGKRSAARAIHRLSQNAGGPLVILSCAAFSDELREAEVAGRLPREEALPAHLCASASGGTLILNELADLSPLAQLKLLRVLQHDEFQTDTDSSRSSRHTRLISTSGHDLAKGVREGRFREDLFYRLAVITLEIPSLRERLEDIPLLVSRFLESHARRSEQDDARSINAEALRVLQGHDFPGNVRELENIVEHTLTVSRSPILTVDDLPKYLVRHVSSAPSTLSLDGDSSDKASDEAILDTLAEHNWNKSRAAKELGIHRSTLWRRMKRLGIDRRAPGSGPKVDLESDEG